jgi:hypothetical protein
MKILALAVWPLFFLITFLLFKMTRYSASHYTYSNLGSHPKYGWLFNATLTITGIIQLMFLGGVLKSRIFEYSLLGVIGLSCLITTTVTGIIAGVIPEYIHDKLHLFISKVGFLFSIVGYILYGLYLFPHIPFVGLFMLTWGLLVMPYQVYRYVSSSNVCAKNEFFMFLGAFLTNTALVYLY